VSGRVPRLYYVSRPKDQQTVTLHSVPWHDSILPQPLRFPPPYAELSTNPAGFSRFWQFMSYAFNLPDPSKFPPFVGELSEDDRRSVERFVFSCRELATYSLMSASDRMTVSVRDGVETLDVDFSGTESLIAAAVLLRQLYSHSDSGSYKHVQGILSKAMGSEPAGDLVELRREILVAWRRAHGALLQQRIEAIVGRMAANEWAGTTSRAPVPFEDLRPTEVISRYLYGDLIHWGDKRDSLAALGADPVMAALDRMHFLEAMCGLSHFYLGFSVLLRSAFKIS
jgi:hypothetical protein